MLAVCQRGCLKGFDGTVHAAPRSCGLSLCSVLRKDKMQHVSHVCQSYIGAVPSIPEQGSAVSALLVLSLCNLLSCRHRTVVSACSKNKYDKTFVASARVLNCLHTFDKSCYLVFKSEPVAFCSFVRSLRPAPADLGQQQDDGTYLMRKCTVF